MVPACTERCAGKRNLLSRDWHTPEGTKMTRCVSPHDEPGRHDVALSYLPLNGHDHIYERFAPQDANATLDTARGMREFIVGTGGSDHTSVTTIAANSEVRNTNTFGVMKLTLHPTGYDWQFVPEAGKTFTDSGSTSCHGSSPAPTATPTRTATAAATATATLVPPTNTPTPTYTPTPTLVTPTYTPTPTAAGGSVSNVTKYYYFASLRVAMRTSAGVTYLFGDHLGSTSAAIDPNGQLTKQGYYAFGGGRYNIGALPTDYTFTGQKSDASDGLMFYGARYYDATIGRFISPDYFVTSFEPQHLNR